MKREVRGSVTVEAAFLVPILLMIICTTVSLLFYSHDKVVLKATAHETVTVMSGKAEIYEEDVEKYFWEHLKGRLLMFEMVDLETKIETDKIYLQCVSWKNGIPVRIDVDMKRTNPELWIRAMNNLLGE